MDHESWLLLMMSNFLKVETKPQDAVSIIECDLNVDFEAPVGYKEPERPGKHPNTLII